jgi:K+-sensing histidine kinase KdpD
VTDIAEIPAADGRAVAGMVDDAGPGIDPAERARIFERFYRGSASGRRGTGTGSGLGLALVAQHVRAMHGEVRVESSPAGGARFVVTLPVIGGDSDEEADAGGDTGVGEGEVTGAGGNGMDAVTR